MAKLKLPEQLQVWKVLSTASETGSYPTFNVTKTEFNGSKTNAVLTYVNFEGDSYNSENVDLVNDEANFVKSVMKLRGVSNYLDAVVDNNPAKSRIDFYLLTTDAKPVKETFADKTFGDAEIVDFGLQISEILEKLEQNNILHGNIKPENVFVNENGKYMLGGFTAFEGTADDPAFLAPEMQQGKQPDYTTDIYSLGLMMYTMANGGKLPFEGDTVDRAAAVQQRRSMATIPAPAGGNEKLKSVIVIACQPENKNRWKNAGNIKNALASIKAELPAAAPQTPAVPERTEFESNVFEEFAVASAVVPPVMAQPEPQQTDINMAKGAAMAAEAAQKQQAAAGGKDVDSNVFDNYEVQTRVFNRQNADNQNYGDFFEDTPAKNEAQAPVAAAKASAAPAVNVPPVAPEQNRTLPENNGAYEAEMVYQEPIKRNKSFVIGVIVIIVAALAALAALGIYAAQNGFLPFLNNNQQASTAPTVPATTAPAVVTTAPTVPSTAAPTTVPETTAEPTTEAPTYPEESYPENVVGYFYDYATEVLTAQGLTVVYDYKSSPDYDEGFVISMSPDSSTLLKRGSTVTIVISSGRTSGSSESSSSESSATLE